MLGHISARPIVVLQARCVGIAGFLVARRNVDAVVVVAATVALVMAALGFPAPAIVRGGGPRRARVVVVVVRVVSATAPGRAVVVVGAVLCVVTTVAVGVTLCSDVVVGRLAGPAVVAVVLVFELLLLFIIIVVCLGLLFDVLFFFLLAHALLLLFLLLVAQGVVKVAQHIVVVLGEKAQGPRAAVVRLLEGDGAHLEGVAAHRQLLSHALPRLVHVFPRVDASNEPQRTGLALGLHGVAGDGWPRVNWEPEKPGRQRGLLLLKVCGVEVTRKRVE
jgi:hypothetical protein